MSDDGRPPGNGSSEEPREPRFSGRIHFQDPETAVMGTALHALEWLFVRAAPVLLIGGAAGAFLTRKRA